MPPTPTATPSGEPGLIDVGGYSLFMICEGEGNPAVVIDAGQLDTIAEWRAVLTGIAEFTRVCYYDRAGVGASESGPTPRTSQTIVDELHTLVVNAGISTPLILVGASFGGFTSLLFADQYPDLVAGLVLVDSEHPRQRERLASYLLPSWVWVPFEGVDWEESAAQVEATGSLGNLPLTVLSASLHGFLPGGEGVWSDMQEELANKSTAGTQVVVEMSGHHINMDIPTAVVDAVQLMVDDVRASE